MTRAYEHFGGFEIPRRHEIVASNELTKFWVEVEDQYPGLATARGCYIFAVSAGGSIKPWYVGKASGENGFRQEAFAPHKLNHYNEYLAGKRGRPLLYLVAARTEGGRFRKAADTEVLWVEDFLISLAVEANDELLNKRNVGFLRDCMIPGLLNSAAGGSSKMKAEIRGMFNIRT